MSLTGNISLQCLQVLSTSDILAYLWAFIVHNFLQKSKGKKGPTTAAPSNQTSGELIKYLSTTKLTYCDAVYYMFPAFATGLN